MNFEIIVCRSPDCSIYNASVIIYLRNEKQRTSQKQKVNFFSIVLVQVTTYLRFPLPVNERVE